MADETKLVFRKNLNRGLYIEEFDSNVQELKNVILEVKDLYNPDNFSFNDGLTVNKNGSGTTLRVFNTGVGDTFQAGEANTAFRIKKSGRVSLGSGDPGTTNFKIDRDIGGGTTVTGMSIQSQVLKDVTSSAIGFQTDLSTEADTFNLTNLYHFRARLDGLGSGSTVTNHCGFYADSTISGATNNFGFYGNVSAGDGKWNFYANGSARNYMSSGLLLGANSLSLPNDYWSSGYLMMPNGFVGSLGSFGMDITSNGWRNSSGTWTSFNINGQTGRASISLRPTGNILFGADDGGTSIFPTVRMVLNPDGAIGIGSTSLTGYNLRVSKAIVGNLSSKGIVSDGVVQPSVTTRADLFATNAGTAANDGTGYTVANLSHYRASQGTFHANSSVTEQAGFSVDSNLIGATNNYAFKGEIPSGTGRWNIYMSGTARNYMAGALNVGDTSQATDQPAIDLVKSGAQLTLSSSASNSTNKVGIVTVRHYTNTEEGVAALVLTSGSSTNDLVIGGGSASHNAISSLTVRTAANNNTLNGTERFSIDANGNVSVGSNQLANDATNGFLYIPGTTSGVPTGTPTSKTGRHAMVVDDTNDKFFVYNGSWKWAPLNVGAVGEFDAGNSGTSKAIAWNAGMKQKVTLNGNVTITFDFTGCKVGNYQLRLVQDGTGSRTVTWSTGTPGTTRWIGTVGAPSIAPTPNSETFVNLYWDGTTVTGSMGRVGMA